MKNGRMVVEDSNRIFTNLKNLLKQIENHHIKLLEIPTSSITTDQLNDIAPLIENAVIKRNKIIIENPTKKLIDYLDSHNISYRVK
jgi:pyruvate/2-oxoglutarate/acetoin dehydrogenase E1 component